MAVRWRRDRTVLHALAEVGIRLYQRFVSPRKGYRCSHAAVHGGPSCSAFGMAAFRTLPLGEAVRRLRERFEACQMASGKHKPGRRGYPRDWRRRRDGSSASDWDVSSSGGFMGGPCHHCHPLDATELLRFLPWCH